MTQTTETETKSAAGAPSGSALRGLIRTMRPHQWTKNVLIFAALFFDKKLLEPEPLLRTAIGFILLCLVASTIYLINDIVDVENDRQHPTKRNRPIASGRLPVSWATTAAFILPAIAIPLGFVMSFGFGLILVTYFALHVLYSYRLKRIVIIDILSIAAGFVLRVAAGTVIITVENFSPWLYVCTIMLSLFLAVGKRRQEYLEMGANAENVRSVFKMYNIDLLNEMLRLSVTSTFLCYVLYTVETPIYTEPGFRNLGLITIPFVLYALLHYLYLIYVKGEGSAPDEVLLKDRKLQLTVALWIMVFMFILYIPPALNWV